MNAMNGIRDERITVFATGECECGEPLVVLFVGHLRDTGKGWIIFVDPTQEASCDKCGKKYRPDSPEIEWPVRLKILKRNIDAVIRLL